MQFKRIAAVAAAAVVGPTVLMSTPAMADEQQQPAVSVPDAAPKDDPAPAADPTPETAPAPGTAPVVPPVVAPVVPPAAQPEAPAPAPVTPAPAAETTGQTPSPQSYPGDYQGIGPDVTLSGLPKDGFQPGGAWTPLTLTIDNSAHIEVAKFTPVVTLNETSGRLTARHLKIEYLAADNTWKPAERLSAVRNGPGYDYATGTPSAIARGETRTVQLRIGFTDDAPVVAFDLMSSGLRLRADGGRVWSPTGLHQSKMTGAADNTTRPTIVDGPVFTLAGMPSDGFKAGGAWQDLTLRMDNSGKPAQDHYEVTVIAARPDGVGLRASQVKAEIFGKNGWEPLEGYAENRLYLGISNVPIAAGQVSDIKLRVRFTADTPAGDVVFSALGSAPFDADDYSYTTSRSAKHLARILAADPATGGTGNTANQPVPNGGSQPIVNAGTGTGTGTQPAAASGELAATGSDPATAWALGGAGVALAMGAALVAGTGRHRRRSTA